MHMHKPTKINKFYLFVCVCVLLIYYADSD